MADRKPTLRDADAYDFNGLRDRIIDLAGFGYDAPYIAKTVGEPYEKVRRILKAYYEERCADRERVIQALDENLHWLQLKTAKAVAASVEGKGGKLDLKAGELFLKIVDRRARLHGADKPQEHKVEIVQEQLTPEELVAQLQANGISVSFPTALPPHTPPQPPHVIDAEYEVHPDRVEADLPHRPPEPDPREDSPGQ